MLDLNLRCEEVQPAVNCDRYLVDVELKRIDERSLREQEDKILPHVSDEAILKEIKSRRLYIPEEDEVEVLKEKIEELSDALRDIEDVACSARG